MRLFLNLLIVVGVVLFAAMCLHSIEEIHYLKSFFPRHFTVEESFYAAAVELIKIILIGLPILLIIGICLRKLRELKKER
jgi:lipopolysaccharide export LptBFGC system permease protein LptF